MAQSVHAAGQVFDLHPGARGRTAIENSSVNALADSVVIDPSWAIEKVYQLLKPSTDGEEGVFELVRQKQGRVERALLLSHTALDEVPELAEPLLQFMQQCDILAPLKGWRDGPDAQVPTEYLVTEKCLLPRFEGELQRQCDTAVESARKRPGVQGLQVTFPQARLCEFDFRPILAHVARQWGPPGMYFRDGFQVSLGTNAEAAVLLRGRWIPEGENEAVGRLVLGGLGTPERLEQLKGKWREVLEEAMPGGGGERSRRSRAVESPAGRRAGRSTKCAGRSGEIAARVDQLQP